MAEMDVVYLMKFKLVQRNWSGRQPLDFDPSACVLLFCWLGLTSARCALLNNKMAAVRCIITIFSWTKKTNQQFFSKGN